MGAAPARVSPGRAAARSLDSQSIGLFAGTALFGAGRGLLARHRVTLGIAVHALANLARLLRS